MIPARTSKRFGGDTKLLVLSENHKTDHTYVRHFADYLDSGDLLIVNRSATLPASFRGILKRTGEWIEIRLASFQGLHRNDLSRWKAFSFGSGDWTIPTEKRTPPPELEVNDIVFFGANLSLEILACDHKRLLDIRFIGEHLEQALYHYGRPIQYSYLSETLAVWDQQTLFSGPPISVEPPSASFPLTWDILFELKKKSVEVAELLHGAGISSTGSVKLDALLPLSEWYEIPERTAEKFKRAKDNQRNIVALGTTVLRALESAWDGEKLRTGSGITELKIHPGHSLKTANALVTGMHEVGTSHMNILDSICNLDHIRAAYAEAEQRGYRNHEFGDIAYLRCK